MAYAHEESTQVADHPGSRRAARTALRNAVTTERFRWWVVGGVLGAYAAVKAATSMESDPYWSARAGVESLEGAPLARADTWSWSAEGLWYPNSPGWNLVLGLGWQAFSFWGLFGVAFAAISLLFGLAVMLARAAGAQALPTLVGFAPLLLVGSSGLSARATVVVQCLIYLGVLFAWWWGGVAARMKPLVSSLVVGILGFALSLIGNWMHLSFMFMAAALAVMWAIAWWSSPGIGLVVRIGLVVSGSVGFLLGCVLSPYGIVLTLERSQVVEASARGLVTEWMSISTFLQHGKFGVLPMAVVAIIAATFCTYSVLRLLRRHGRFDPRVRLLLPLTCFGALAVVAGLEVTRFIAVGLLALLPVAGVSASWLIQRLRRRQRRGRGFWSRPRVLNYTSGRFLTVVIVVVGLVMSPLAALRIVQGIRPPEAAVAEVLPQGCLVWAKPRGAALFILMRPDVKVWIDGRFDFYGRDHLVQHLRILSARDPLPAEANCAVLPSRSIEVHRLADVLDDHSEWSRVAEVEGSVLWVRE